MSFEYRNLAPLYVSEQLRVCVKKYSAKDNKYDVWIEGKEGGYAVKGTAVVGEIETVLEEPSDNLKKS